MRKIERGFAVQELNFNGGGKAALCAKDSEGRVKKREKRQSRKL
jgi:hypothetical protein